MTEERIKELGKLALKLSCNAVLTEYFHIMAAEARKEGIEEGIGEIKSNLREHAKWKLHMIASTGEWREGYKAAIEWVIANVEYAEDMKQLKEQKE